MQKMMDGGGPLLDQITLGIEESRTLASEIYRRVDRIIDMLTGPTPKTAGEEAKQPTQGVFHNQLESITQVRGFQRASLGVIGNIEKALGISSAEGR